jgi:hypothetical protein
MDAKTRNCLFGFTEDNPSDEVEDQKEPINYCPGCKNHDCDNCDL